MRPAYSDVLSTNRASQPFQYHKLWKSRQEILRYTPYFKRRRYDGWNSVRRRSKSVTEGIRWFRVGTVHAAPALFFPQGLCAWLLKPTSSHIDGRTYQKWLTAWPRAAKGHVKVTSPRVISFWNASMIYRVGLTKCATESDVFLRFWNTRNAWNERWRDGRIGYRDHLFSTTGRRPGYETTWCNK